MKTSVPSGSSVFWHIRLTRTAVLLCSVHFSENMWFTGSGSVAPFHVPSKSTETRYQSCAGGYAGGLRARGRLAAVAGAGTAVSAMSASVQTIRLGISGLRGFERAGWGRSAVRRARARRGSWLAANATKRPSAEIAGWLDGRSPFAPAAPARELRTVVFFRRSRGDVGAGVAVVGAEVGGSRGERDKAPTGRHHRVNEAAVGLGPYDARAPARQRRVRRRRRRGRSAERHGARRPRAALSGHCGERRGADTGSGRRRVRSGAPRLVRVAKACRSRSSAARRSGSPASAA